MKLKNLIVFAFFAALGFVGTIHAGYITTKSSAICISTGTDMEVTRITISSAQGSINDVYVVLVDTIPTGWGNVSAFSSNTLPSVSGDFTESRYPVHTWRLPALIAASSNTVNNYGNMSVTYPFPEGLNFEQGITMFIIKSAANNTQVTVEYDKRRPIGRR